VVAACAAPDPDDSDNPSVHGVGGAPYNAGLSASEDAAARRTQPPFYSELPVFISSAFAQTAPAATGGDMQSSLMSMLPLVLMFVVLYFVMIRPQMKKQKEHRAMVEALAKGDEVVTSGGVLGKVAKLGDSYLAVEISNGVEVQIQRGSVIQVLPKGTIK
jgi:preprotein translocase subunit YajC